MLTKKGTFVSNTSTGSQAVAQVGFTPKAILFWWTYQTSEGFATGLRFGVGFASASARGTSSVASDDAAATSNTGESANSAQCIRFLSAGTPTAAGTANGCTLDADGFTLNWNTAPSQANIVHYMAIGGSDVTDAKTGTLTQAASSGDQAFTGVGFQPDIVFFLTHRASTANTTTAFARWGIGVAKSSSEQGVYALEDSDNVATTTVAQYQRSDRCLATLSGHAVSYEASLVSMDADGFTLNYPSVAGFADVFYYLAIKGGNYTVGAETQKTSTGTKAKTGLGSIVPKALLCFGGNATASASVSTTLQKFSLGAATSTATGAIWASSTDNLDDSDTNMYTSDDAVLLHGTNAATTDALAVLSSFDKSAFTLDWTTADATAREFIFVAFGDVAISPGACAATAVGLAPAHTAAFDPPSATGTASSPAPTPTLILPPDAASATGTALAPSIVLTAPSVAAVATAGAPIPIVASSDAVVVPVAVATASSPIPGVSIALTVPVASATASAPTPTVSIALSTPPAAATASGPTPVLTITDTITAPTAAATGASPVPIASIAVSAPTATSTATCLAPTLTVTDTITVPAATATASGPAPIVAASTSIAVPVAAASANAEPPVIPIVIAASCSATASTPAPDLALVISLARGIATASMRAPTILNPIAAVPAEAIASALAPDTIKRPPASDATAGAEAPDVLIGVPLVQGVATATLATPVVRVTMNSLAALATAYSPAPGVAAYSPPRIPFNVAFTSKPDRVAFTTKPDKVVVG